MEAWELRFFCFSRYCRREENKIEKESLFGKTGMKNSTYEQMRKKAALLFLASEPERLITEKELAHDGQYIYMRLLDREYRIDRSSGETFRNDGGEYLRSDFYSAMILYDVIAYSDPLAFCSGTYTALQNLSSVYNVHSYAGEGMFERTVRAIARKPEDFRSACLRLGGVSDPIGDISYRIPCLFHRGTLSVILRFYEADEDFHAQLSLLFDRNTLRYMHYETAWYLAAHLLSRVSEPGNPDP